MESDRFSDMQFEQYFMDFELLCRWMMKHNSHVVDFANLDFETIDTEILANKANEKEVKPVRDIKLGVLLKKRFGYFLGHLYFWVSGVKSQLIFYTKKKKEKLNTKNT